MEETKFDTHGRKHERSLVGPLILIFIGLVFLANNFGILPYAIWNQIGRFWPVILILIGTKILLGRSLLSQSLLVILILLILGLILVFALTQGPTPYYPNMMMGRGYWY